MCVVQRLVDECKVEWRRSVKKQNNKQKASYLWVDKE